jgi:UDP-GlcNAc3NAcA epimerase
MKLPTVIGARPQFIKAAAVAYAIERARAAGSEIDSILVHTGQHYDARMSQVFFDELRLPAPDYNLEVGSSSHGAQTGRMLEKVEEIILRERPDVVIVYGDTNSTLAGALAAAKLHVPVAHVEAGLRSFNRRMPEELNRILTDHLSQWLFCPTTVAAANLANEGVQKGVQIVGDVMYELVCQFQPTDGQGSSPAGQRILATIHRAENTDDLGRFEGIVRGLSVLAREVEVTLPLHPRGRARLDSLDQAALRGIRIIDPLSYRQMLEAQGAASVIVTDSGGVQKEAYWLGVPCVTVRDETEWLETLEEDRNILVGADTDRLVTAARAQLARGRLRRPLVSLDRAASSILGTLTNASR